MKIINIFCSKQEKSLVDKKEIKKKSILIRPVSRNLNLSIFQELFKPGICINSPKWSSGHQRVTLSFIPSIHPHRPIQTRLQDQHLSLLSNLVMSWLTKSTESVKVSMLKNTDFQLIKIKCLIKLKKSKIASLIRNNFGQWLKKVLKKISTLPLKLKNSAVQDSKLSEFFLRSNL